MQNIKSIKIGKEEVKLTQYTNDTTVFLRDANSAKCFLKLVKYFGVCSSLKINTDKTEGMWIGSLRNSKQKLFGINWPSNPIKALGIYFSYNETESEEFNFTQKLLSLKQCLNMWRGRNLSIIGRILLVKSLGLSKFVYVASIMSVPEEIIKVINKVTYRFTWINKEKSVVKFCR